MKVLFISPNAERLFMPTLPLGLALVAAATRQAGHVTSFLDLLGSPNPVGAVQEAIRQFMPDVIGISVRNVDDQSMQDTKFLLEPVRDVGAACRTATPAKIVVGGAGYSIFPQAALTYLDADYGAFGSGRVRSRGAAFSIGWTGGKEQVAQSRRHRWISMKGQESWRYET